MIIEPIDAPFEDVVSAVIAPKPNGMPSKYKVRVTYVLDEILIYDVYASGEDQAKAIAELLHKEKTTPLCHNIKSIKVD